ncbi:MAG: kelch repeat-containing protein [Thermoplasmata archaeon]|nr:kelch repeat-containing protein [Thermoplasmata archaeon]MCI4341520.1 kelch repeat-containing protein [Thermoplasmata archaeon]
MAYDAADRYVVLFGGWNGSFLSDTWTYNGLWTQLTPATSPSARASAAIAYDYKDGYMLLFGGLGSGGRLGDTWKFLHGAWTHLTPGSPPPAAAGAGMVWDTNDSYLVLFGGSPSGGTVRSSTFTWVGGAWTTLSPATPPTARENMALGYDNTHGWVVLFGGETGLGAVFLDTWNFTRGHWSQLHPATIPVAVFGATLTNDTIDHYLVLFGGRSSGGVNSAFTWQFVNASWTKLAPATPPSSRAMASAAYDSALNKVVLFGGNHSAGLGDTWTFKADVWLHVATSGPPARVIVSMVYDEADGYVLLFGGARINNGNIGGLLGDTWSYAHGHWTQLRPAVSPSGRVAFGLAYDQADGYVLLFSGEVTVTGTYGNDTWTYLGGKWTQLFPAISPRPRVLSGMVYDAADGYVLLFGGEEYAPNASHVAWSNDSWTFVAGTWTALAPPACVTCGPAPSGRAASAMVYDAWDGYVLLFGGQNGSTIYLDDTWSYLGGTWTNITASAGVPPPGTVGGSAVYDPLDGYVLLYGGLGVGSVAMSDTWSFVGGGWTALSPANNPGADYVAGSAADPVDKTVVYLNGFNQAGGTWLY